MIDGSPLRSNIQDDMLCEQLKFLFTTNCRRFLGSSTSFCITIRFYLYLVFFFLKKKINYYYDCINKNLILHKLILVKDGADKAKAYNWQGFYIRKFHTEFRKLSAALILFVARYQTDEELIHFLFLRAWYSSVYWKKLRAQMTIRFRRVISFYLRKKKMYK